jgi:6-phosphogluconolactonase (cycloisomerase 2 family)
MKVSILRLGSIAALAALGVAATAEAQRTAYVTHFGGDVATFRIGAAGELIPVEIIPGVGNSLRGIAITPDGRAAYVVDSDLATITAFSIGDDGGLIPLASPLETDPGANVPPTAQCAPPATTLISPCPFGVAVTPNGRWVYVTNSESNTVSMFQVHRDGHLTRLGTPVPAGGIGPRGLAVSPNGERLYVAHRNTDAISVFAIEHNGTLTLRGPAVQLRGCTPTPGNPPMAQCSPFWVSITPDGRWLYVTNFVSGDVATFAIAKDGDLTEVHRLVVGPRPEAIAMTSDVRFLYVGLIDDNLIRAFSVDEDGALRVNGSFPVCEQWQTRAACGAVSVALAADRNVYTVTVFKPVNDALSFRIEPDGNLTQIGVVPTGGSGRPQAQALAIRPNQGPVASLRPAGGTVATPIQFDASGSVDSDGQIDRYDWDFGDGQILLDGGSNPSHAYAAPGRYRVTVTVTDNENCSDIQVFTGQTAMCNGSRAANGSRVVQVRVP